MSWWAGVLRHRRPRSVLGAASLAPAFILSASVGFPLPAGAQPAAEVVLLVDRSGSAQSHDYGRQRAQFAQFLVDTLRVESTIAGANVHLAVADFGGTVVERRPLSSLGEEGVSIPVDTEETIAFTDFREPLRYARKVFRSPGGPRRVVVMLTDGIPSLAASAPQDYFGIRDPLVPSGNSVRSALSDLAEAGAESFVLVAGGRPADAIAWRKVLPAGRFLSISDTGDRQAAARAVLSSLSLYLKPSTELTKPDLAPTSLPPLQRHEGELSYWGSRLSFIPRKALLVTVLLVIVFSLLTLTGSTALSFRRRRHAQQRHEQGQPEIEHLRAELRRLEQAMPAARGGIFIQKSDEERQEGLSALEKGDRDEARRRLLLSAGYTLTYVNEGSLFATGNANLIYGDVHDRLFPGDDDQQLSFIRDLVSDELSKRAVEVIAHVLRERWQREPRLFLKEFYKVQIWPQGEGLVEELAVYSPAFTGDSISDLNGLLIEQVARQAKRLNSLVGGFTRER